MKERPGLYFESPHDSENVAIFSFPPDKSKWGASKERGYFLSVTVADEKAVGSYNETFEVEYDFGMDEVERLRDWLNEHFPKDAP